MRTLAAILLVWSVGAAGAQEPVAPAASVATCPSAIDAPADVRQVTSAGLSFKAIVAMDRTAFLAGQASDISLFVHYRYPSKGSTQIAASAVPLRQIKRLPPDARDGKNRVRVEIATALPTPADTGSQMAVVARLVDLMPASGEEVVDFSLDVVLPCDRSLLAAPPAEITARLFEDGLAQDLPLHFASPEALPFDTAGVQRFHYREGTQLTLAHGRYLPMNVVVVRARQFHYRPSEAARCRNRDRRGVPYDDFDFFLHLVPYPLRIFEGLQSQFLVGSLELTLNDQELPAPVPPCDTPPCK